MQALLDWARGPLFVFAIAFMALGLIRHVLVTLYEIVRTIRRAGDKNLPVKQLVSATLNWMLPVKKVRHDPLFSATSMLFHVGVIVVPLFLGGHLVLLAAGVGVSWPNIPNILADILTITTVVTALALIAQRVLARATRALSGPAEYLLPVLVALPFASGFMVMHPGWNPFSYEFTLLIHVMSGNFLMILVPITRLRHAALLPGTQLISELGWRFPADSGSKVEIALGKQGEAI